MRQVTDDERRARLALRHRLTSSAHAATVEEAAESIVCYHATDHSTVVLSAWARVAGFAVADLDRALYEERTLVKQLCMRRTLFVLPRAILEDAVAAAGPRVAREGSRSLARDIERGGIASDGHAWIEEAGAAVLAALADGRQASTTELRDAVPLAAGATKIGSGTSWGRDWAVLPRLLAVLSARGLVVRGRIGGTWMNPRPTYAAMDRWLGGALAAVDPAVGRAELVGRWLRAFGPGTEADIAWWLGGSLGEVRAALDRIGAVPVQVDGASKPGWLHPDDIHEPGPVEPWAALLPALDPATMGWKERDWYLGPHRADVFDSVGNGGTTAWWDGRIVGSWYQPPDARVELILLERVGRVARRALAEEAARLTEWLAGARPGGRWMAPAAAAASRGERVG
jgi:hypothetical protein